jgi:hypothetical protein
MEENPIIWRYKKIGKQKLRNMKREKITKGNEPALDK